MKRSVKRLCCAMLATWLVALTPLAVSAETVEEIQAQQQQLEEENQELNAKLESLREDEAQKQAYRETLQEQIDLVQQQILTTRENIQQILQDEVGLVFSKVLEDAGVYKCTEKGRQDFTRFLNSVGFEG